MKRVNIRQCGRSTAPCGTGTSEDVIGWMNNSHNIGGGWSVHKATEEEKKEFGRNAVRIHSDKGTTIAKIYLTSGSFSVVDNEAYEAGELKFDKPTPYRMVLVDKVEFLTDFGGKR